MIERSQVQIPAGPAGEFSSMLTVISVSVPLSCYRSSK